ncbi:hypothetical protein ACRQ5Q_16810 [Bradyrhizobium sp. PMVTL-01]|uniref:hypothetical protein n=1 Tax=Bradyrhizobium sp. PMVTL-01 TaxID=3434999 RepID=UPI003F70D416
MSARITTERTLRDDDDMTGQSIRDWKIESEAGHVTIRMKHGDGFILLRSDDVDQFIIDLNRATDLARDLTAEREGA